MSETEAKAQLDSMVADPAQPHVNWGNILKIVQGVGQQLPVILKVIEGLTGVVPSA